MNESPFAEAAYSAEAAAKAGSREGGSLAPPRAQFTRSLVTQPDACAVYAVTRHFCHASKAV